MTEKLPIHDVLDELMKTMQQHDEAVLQAPPGAGKTTLVPLEFLKQEFLQEQKILMLEPRRIAARNAAARMAELLGEKVGATIGYRMRLDTRVSSHTRIEVVTEGVLLRILQEDPALTDYSLIIFDEFHERSLDADLGLALTLKSRELFRETPLKLLIMSATLEGERIAEHLSGAPVVQSEGRSYPVAIRYCGAAQLRERIVPRLLKVTLQALTENPTSSLLVFLPGEGEIRSLQRDLAPRLPSDVVVSPLFGNLDLETQRQAIQPAPGGQRKVVLATNIAESSLTIEGVSVVIDSGLERRARFDPNTAMSRLQTGRISQASAAQRAGRAGRLAAGVCYRLWSEDQQNQLALNAVPEILEADLSQLVLQVLNWGIAARDELTWLDQPPQANWQQALDLLDQFSAITTSQPLHLSEHGEQMANLNLPPRISHMLIWAKAFNAQALGCALAAIWSERDPFSRSAEFNWRLDIRVDVVLGKTLCPPQQQGWLHRCHQQIQQLQRQIERFDPQAIETALPQEAILGCLVALAFPDRIARKRHSGGYQLANGRSAKIPDGARANEKWLSVAEVSGGTSGSDIIRTATPLDESLFTTHLAELRKQSRVVHWDKKSARFIAEEQTRIGQLVLWKKSLSEIDPTERDNVICDYIANQGFTLFKKYRQFVELQNRCAVMYQYHKDKVYDLSTETLTETITEWLAPYLSGVNKLDEIVKIDIAKVCWDRMSFAEQTALDDFAPERFRVPSGSSYKIDYSEEQPILAVKLQEMFGCDDTPGIAGGKIKLTVHLLSPAGRPLQITQDLAGFWRSSYQAVRKEMRGRYPKHPWPEDPTQAIATRHTKRNS